MAAPTRRIALLLVIGLAVFATAGCGGSDGEATDASPAPAAPPPATPPPPPATDGPAQCSDVEAPAPREDGGAQAPEERLDPEVTHTLRFETSCGAFTVTLDLESAPATSASLVALAKAGFYDATVFHRIAPGFVIQGGDPTATGSGGPGYQTVDAPAQDAAYVKGVVAMAKTGAEAPGTAGSQFFVVTGDDIGLPPDYAVVGAVTEGLEVVELIGTKGDPATELPTQPIVVDRVVASP